MLVDEGPPMADNDVGPAEAATVRANLDRARAQVRVDGHKAVQESIASQQPGRKGVVRRDCGT